MPKVQIQIVTRPNNWENSTLRVILPDGTKIEGMVGGEPEDNSIFRTYCWIPDIIEALAKALGAEVEQLPNVEEEYEW
jgi:hypothetical protein